MPKDSNQVELNAGDCVKVIKVIVKIIKITIYTWILEMIMLNIFYYWF